MSRKRIYKRKQIPRSDGDTPNPRGGVRGVIPEKMDYGE
jgi:hypothetical protein